MDRRQFDREASNLELYVQSGAHRAQRLRVRDISTQGVFVEGWDSPPRQGAEVSLTFLIGSGSVVKLMRRAARVARVTRDGVGLVHGTRLRSVTRAPRAGLAARSPWFSLRRPDVE